MKDEEVRLQHQSSLLRLRQKAVREKTKTELAWLEHQKKRLRDKGEDDKMPPIRKKQRGLLLKLQQEQVFDPKQTQITSHSEYVVSISISANLFIFFFHDQRLRSSDSRRPIKQRGKKGNF